MARERRDQLCLAFRWDPTWLQALGFLSIKWEVGYVRGLFLIRPYCSENIIGRQKGTTLQGPTCLSSKTGLSGSESLPLPPLPLLLLPRDKGLLWDGEPASEGGGLSVPTTSGFMPSMGTSKFPPLPQADTRSFRDSVGKKRAGLVMKARDPIPAKLTQGPGGRGRLGVGLASGGSLGPKERLRALVGSETGVDQGWRWGQNQG